MLGRICLAIAALAATAQPKAVITNYCDETVYLWSIPNNRGYAEDRPLKSGGWQYIETFHKGTPQNPGIAIKIFLEPELMHADRSHLNFGYTVDPSVPDDVWVSLDAVAGDPFHGYVTLHTCNGLYKGPYVNTHLCSLNDNVEIVLCGDKRNTPQFDTAPWEILSQCAASSLSHRSSVNHTNPRRLLACKGRVYAPRNDSLPKQEFDMGKIWSTLITSSGSKSSTGSSTKSPIKSSTKYSNSSSVTKSWTKSSKCSTGCPTPAIQNLDDEFQPASLDRTRGDETCSCNFKDGQGYQCSCTWLVTPEGMTAFQNSTTTGSVKVSTPASNLVASPTAQCTPRPNQPKQDCRCILDSDQREFDCGCQKNIDKDINEGHCSMHLAVEYCFKPSPLTFTMYGVDSDCFSTKYAPEFAFWLYLRSCVVAYKNDIDCDLFEDILRDKYPQVEEMARQRYAVTASRTTTAAIGFRTQRQAGLACRELHQLFDAEFGDGLTCKQLAQEIKEKYGNKKVNLETWKNEYLPGIDDTSDIEAEFEKSWPDINWSTDEE
ncbi:hypothetical protein M011DRAFT_456625 [Sporormia fimetaria CBS 119925]|uniref:Uncharacterized protein n=1 Tax=Sporormia fimetaria CBS 119925 TaxID=1340428 RepID=A0A6A6VJI5_9PLEO|nr:hypothetical protein M011DRAFT_456625 [Sporormia fimetaria CBS 119925]